MLWALLITLLITKLSGGPEEIFMVDDLKKEIKNNVTDQDRSKEILLLVKEAKTEIKTFGKLRKHKLKQLKKISQDRAVTTEELLNVFQEYFDARMAMQAKLIDDRLQIQELLNDEEWKQIIEPAVLPSEKAKKKIEKSESKENDKVEKFINDLKKEINNKLEEESKKKIINDKLDIFILTLKEFVEEGHKMNFEDNQLVRNKNASREDLEGFYQRHNALRMKGTKEYFNIREVALQNTNEKEWKAIIKSLNSLVKS